MKTIVDYVSFSIPVLKSTDGDDGAWWRSVTDELFTIEELYPLFDDRWHWKGGVAMKPYNRAWHRNDAGLSIHGNPNMPHITIQISGGGCAQLRADGQFEAILLAVSERITRIDIATDILTSVTPKEFANCRLAGKFKSGGEQHSPTGATEYVGSRKSEQFLRVYVYNEPHPRAGILRVEFELHRQHAKSCALGVLSEGEAKVAAYLGKKFGLQHSVWEPEDFDNMDLRPATPERKGTPKLMWLTKQVAPTIRRLHEEGTFDARAWIEEVLA